LNAVSHIVFGDEAAARDRPSLKYTLTGVVLNAAAVTAWAGVQHFLLTRRRGRARPAIARELLRGAATSGLAYAVDYALVPRRLNPGFEQRLSGGALVAIYGILAFSLGLGSLLRGGRPSRDSNAGPSAPEADALSS
jgi:hypothetical protein